MESGERVAEREGTQEGQKKRKRTEIGGEGVACGKITLHCDFFYRIITIRNI
jgi:hypothetical protein